MSSVQSIGSGEVRAAIAVAAQRTGTDFNYLLAQARLESSLDPAAQASTSSAAGLYQFTGGTWLRTLDQHGAQYGLDWAGAAIENGQVADPATRVRIMALRFDPQVSALMAGELANDNKLALTNALGRSPDSAELYLAHFLGSAGAVQFLSALAADPAQSAAGVLPRAAEANRGIFFERSGAPRSVGQVMDLLRGRLDAAMDGGGAFDPSAGGGWAINAAAYGAPASYHGAAAPEAPRPVSMADTLRDAFALNDTAAAPAHVQAAYGALQRFGL